MKKELTLEALVSNIDKVTDFINRELKEYSCPERARKQIDIAIDELFGNIARYAYNPEVGAATVIIEVVENPLSVELTFMDDGKAYNPLERADPDTKLSAEDRPVGGLGIYMVKKSMDELVYEYKDGKNILKIRKSMKHSDKVK